MSKTAEVIEAESIVICHRSTVESKGWKAITEDIADAIRSARADGAKQRQDEIVKVIEQLLIDYSAKRDEVSEIGSGPYKTASDRLAGVNMVLQMIHMIEDDGK